VNSFCRKIEELEAQLEFERLKREKRESELDECRTEIARLINTLRSLEDKKLHPRVRFLSKQSKENAFLFFSIDHQVPLDNIKLKNHHQLLANNHDASKKTLDLYLYVEILLILNSFFCIFFAI
jgi:viroplasmin and RNaseH domain-containing protein